MGKTGNKVGKQIEAYVERTVEAAIPQRIKTAEKDNVHFRQTINKQRLEVSRLKRQVVEITDRTEKEIKDGIHFALRNSVWGVDVGDFVWFLGFKYTDVACAVCVSTRKVTAKFTGYSVTITCPACDGNTQKKEVVIESGFIHQIKVTRWGYPEGGKIHINKDVDLFLSDKLGGNSRRIFTIIDDKLYRTEEEAVEALELVVEDDEND